MTTPTSLHADCELTKLFEPISETQAAGRDLDGTLELSAFEMLVREPETAPIAGVDWQDERDWRAIGRQALELLETSKDIRVAVQLARAQLYTQGLHGFCQVVCSICDLTQHYWSSVYPQLDADNAEPTARVNALEELASQPMLNHVRRTHLATAPGLGPVSIKEALAAGSGASPDVSAQTKASLDALGVDGVGVHLAQIRAARDAIARLTAFVREQSGTLIRLKPLTAPEDERPGLLDALETLFAAAHERLAANHAGMTAARTADGEAAPAASSSRAYSGAVTSRADVITTLDRVCAYYSAIEPSSPVPLLLRRAQRLVPLDFLAIVRDLARDGLGDIAKIAGVEDQATLTRAAQQSNDRQ